MLFMLDNLDSKLNSIYSHMKNAKEEQGNWTTYHKSTERPYYCKEIKIKTNEPEKENEKKIRELSIFE